MYDVADLSPHGIIKTYQPVSESASNAVGPVFASRSGNTKDHHKYGTNCLTAWHAGIRVEV